MSCHQFLLRPSSPSLSLSFVFISFSHTCSPPALRVQFTHRDICGQPSLPAPILLFLLPLLSVCPTCLHFAGNYTCRPPVHSEHHTSATLYLTPLCTTLSFSISQLTHLSVPLHLLALVPSLPSQYLALPFPGRDDDEKGGGGREVKRKRMSD